jgi:branched-chain amino acid transport system ATP-binding protein
MGGEAALLEVAGLTVRYGAVEAVRDVALRVHAGETVCLIGANGAGKTTTLRALSGVVRAAAGTVTFAGQRIERKRPAEIVAAGLVQCPEGRLVFGRMNVEENLRLGGYSRRHDPAVLEEVERVYALFPVLGERRRQAAGTLSGGEQQMLAIGRALMGRPRLLLLDEPSLGLAPVIVERIFETIGALGREGLAVLLVEQNAALALAASSRAYVLELGEVVVSGAAAELRGDDRVRRAYLGE